MLNSLPPPPAVGWLRPGQLQAAGPVSNQHSARGILIGCWSGHWLELAWTSQTGVLRCYAAAVADDPDCMMLQLSCSAQYRSVDSRSVNPSSSALRAHAFLSFLSDSIRYSNWKKHSPSANLHQAAISTFNHLTIRFSVCHFLSVVHWNRAAMSKMFLILAPCSRLSIAVTSFFSASHAKERSNKHYDSQCLLADGIGGESGADLGTFSMFGPNRDPTKRDSTSQRMSDISATFLVCYTACCDI